jgi:hypothetical protein
MALSDPVITITGLLKIQLPGGTIRLCDGGFVPWAADGGTYVSEDPLYGTVESINELNENIGDEAPSWELTLLPPSVALSSGLYQPNAQRSPVTTWLAEINPATGQIVGTPDKMGSGFVDSLVLRASTDGRRVVMTIVSEAERLFWTKEGNVLSSTFHKSVWPGELGFDFATGSQIQVPWGVSGPGRGTTSVGGTLSGISGGGTWHSGPTVHSS